MLGKAGHLSQKASMNKGPQEYHIICNFNSATLAQRLDTEYVCAKQSSQHIACVQ